MDGTDPRVLHREAGRLRVGHHRYALRPRAPRIPFQARAAPLAGRSLSSFSFLNPAFLWALPLASIPILIHFLSKRRLPEVRFPTVMFLRALEPREIRRIRLREI